jgi:hypothetical protein
MRFALFSVLLTISAGALGAQTIERPQPFDSAQRIVAVTPALAERLHLQAPTWPASGDYREVRLYSVEPGGGFVLVVQRASGALERFSINDGERVALRSAIDAGMSTTGRPSAESANDIISEPAGNAFARHQTLLAAVLYAPLAASVADNGSVAGSLYLLVTGGTFFASYAATQSMPFTRAQSALAADLGFASAADGLLIGYAATGNADKGVRAGAFAAAVIGTIAGATAGQSLSDAEAHAAFLGIESSAAATVAAAAGFGAPGRGAAAAVALAAPLGYALGVQYPRHVGYHVTAGDVEAVGTAGLIGTLAAGAAVAQIDKPSSRQVAAFLAPGFLVGAFLGDRGIARRLDLSEAQAGILNVGAGAGALIGASIPLIGNSHSTSATLSAAAVGAIVGVSGIAASFNSADKSGPSSPSSPGRFRSRHSDAGPRLTVGSTSLVAALAGVPGRHVLARLIF